MTRARLRPDRPPAAPRRAGTTAVAWALGLGAALALAAAAWPAAAQVRRAPPARPAGVPSRVQRVEPAEAEEPAARAPAIAGALRDSVGVPVARRLLSSGDADARLRGIARLGALGTDEAVEALLDAMEQGSAVGRDPRARLEAVRALARHAKRASVRQLLVRELTDAAAASGRGAVSPLGEILRGTAALALARSGDKRALGALVSAVVQGGAAGEAAAAAMRAYPPPSLQLLLGGRKRLAPGLLRFLGELGDLRALDRLRPLLDGKEASIQIAAARALARLGDEAALPRARAWLRKPEPRLLEAAAEILADLGAPEAPDAIAALLKSGATREAGLRLAERAPAPRLAKELGAAIPLLPAEARSRAVAAMGRGGGAEAIRQLSALTGQPELATAAAFALAILPDPAARAALEGLLSRGDKDPDLRRLALRAGVVRGLALRDAPDAIEPRLSAALASKVPSERAVGAFGLAALGLSDVGALVGGCSARSCDAAVVHAAARGALARGDAALAPLSALLERLALADGVTGGASPTAVAAGAALVADPSGGAVATSTLAAWAEGGGALSPLAARALATRDDAAIRGRIKRLLAGSDPVVRAHVALGLGRDPEEDSVSLLADAYRFEDDAAVRRAIVRGLSRRTEVQRRRALILARDLDPDEGVRSLARAALEGRDLDPPAAPRAAGVVWIAIVANGGSMVEGGAASAGGRAARVVRPDGLAVPVVADPDGVLLVPGVPPGQGAVALAPAVMPEDAARP